MFVRVSHIVLHRTKKMLARSISRFNSASLVENITPILQYSDPVVYSELNLESCHTRKKLIRTLIQGYFRSTSSIRKRTQRLFKIVNPEQWRERVRACVVQLLNCEVKIHPFIRHPLSYGGKLPYYEQVVYETQFMEKIVFHMEYTRTEEQCVRGTAEALRAMFQNCLDYSLRVNHSHPTLIEDARTMYRDIVYPAFPELIPRKLWIDGLTERTRKTGIDNFVELCQREKEINERLINRLDRKRKLEIQRAHTHHQRSMMNVATTEQQRELWYREKVARVCELGLLRAHKKQMIVVECSDDERENNRNEEEEEK